MGPIMRKRWAEGSAVPTSTNADSGSDSDEDEAKSYASGENGDDEVLIDDESSHASCNNDNKPLKSLFGVDLTFSDFFTVFGPGSLVGASTELSGVTCSLPLDVYKLFNKDKKGRVPALELFMALALYSTGHVKDRMAFCFMVFDDDGNNSLDREEMLVLIRSATRTLFKLGDLPAVPTNAVIDRVRDDLFSKYVVDGEEKEALDIDDFFEWAKQSQHSAALMDKFNRVAAELKQEDEARQAAGKISWAIKPVKHSRAWGAKLPDKSCYDFDEEGPLGSPFKQVGEQLKRVAECIETAIITQQTPAHELAKTLPQGGPVVNFAGLVSSLTAVKTTAAYLAEARERLIQQRQQSQYSPDHTVSNTPQHCVGTGIPPVDSIQQMADSMQVMPSTGDCDTGNGVFMTGVTFPLSPQASQSLESVYSMTNSGASPTATTMRRTRTENGLLSPSQQKKAIEKTAEALGISIVPFSPIQRPSTAQRLLNERREADGLGTLLQSPSPSRTLPRAASSGVLLSPTGKHQLAKLNLSATCRDDKGNIVATCTGKPLTPTSRNDTHDESVLMCDMPPVRLGPSKRLLPPVNTSFTATATTMLSPTSAIGDDHDMIELMAMPSFNSGCTPSPTRCKTASFNSRHISGLLLSPVSPQSYQRYYGQSSDSVAPTTITAQPHERRRLAQLTRSSYNPSLSSTSTAIRTSPKSKQFTFPTSPGPHHQRQRSNSPPSQLRGIGSGYGGRTRIDLQEFHKRLQQL